MKTIYILPIAVLLIFGCADKEDDNLDPSNTDYNVSALLIQNQDKFVDTPSDDTNEEEGIDPYELKDAWLDGTDLKITVSYGGGCEVHEFELNWPEVVDLMYPPTFDVVLYHDANGDTCEAYLTETLTIDLSDNGIVIEEQLPIMNVGIINASNQEEKVFIND